MNNFVKVYEEIKRRKENLERGGINSIPFPFRGFNKVIPGIIPETQTTLTTVSGAGKTLFSTNIYVQHPFNYWMENKDKMDIDVEIFLFCLEDSIELTTKRMIIRQLWEQCGIRLSMFKLNSYFQGDKLDDETLKAINSLNPYFEKFFSKVHLIDSTKNPYGIYNKVREWLERPENGKIVDEHGNTLNKQQIEEANKNHAKTTYVPSVSNRFVIVILDNMQNVTPEKDDTKWNALDKLCRTYMRDRLCNYYKTSNLIIAQQEKSKERTVYNMDGDVVTGKFLPDLASIAEYKNVTDSSHLVLGLFYPWRYKIRTYPEDHDSYNIEKLESYYRNLHILKSNFADMDTNVSLLFDGVAGVVSELPSPISPDMHKVYAYVEELIQNKKGLVKLKM
jgi:hypothetical protein